MQISEAKPQRDGKPKGAVKKRKFFYSPLGIGKNAQNGRIESLADDIRTLIGFNGRISALTFAKAL